MCSGLYCWYHSLLLLDSTRLLLLLLLLIIIHCLNLYIYIYSDYIGTYSKNQLSKIESDQPQKNYPNTGPAIRALYRVPLWRTAEELHETPPVDKLITSTSINLAASS